MSTVPLVAGWVVNTYLLGAFTHAFVSYLTVEKKRPDSRVVSSTLFSVLVLEYIYFAFSLEELFGYAGESDPMRLDGKVDAEQMRPCHLFKAANTGM